MNPPVKKALKAKRESRYVEFKLTFDPHSSQDWCELLKDFAAIANSGGGVVLVGVDNQGRATGEDLMPILELDPVSISDKLHRYTDAHFANFGIHEGRKNGKRVAAIKIGPAFPPIVFTKPGTYPVNQDRQKTAFARGTVYFRHGAKSEPGNSNDLRAVLEREMENVRKTWLNDVRKVVRAPAGSQIAVLPPTIRHADAPEERPIQIVNDPTAPAYRVVDFDKTHPFRGKEAIAEINRRLPEGAVFNSFDLQCVRRTHLTDKRDEFVHKHKFGPPQYSQSFVDWVVRHFIRDRQFFNKARDKYRSAKAKNLTSA